MHYTIQDPIRYKLKKTWELLEKADSQIIENDLNSALLNLYFACYTITQALALKHEMKISNHEELKMFLHRKFTLKNRFSEQNERIYSRLYIYRREIIENEIEFTDIEKIKEYSIRTQRFTTEVGKLLKTL